MRFGPEDEVVFRTKDSACSPESLPPAPLADCNRHHSFDRRLDVAAGRRQWRTSSCQALVNAHRWFGTGNAVLSAQMRGSADFARVSSAWQFSARTQLALRSRISGPVKLSSGHPAARTSGHG